MEEEAPSNLYDNNILQTDPRETQNRIDTPEHQDRIRQMDEEVFDTFNASGATDLQFRRLSNFQANERAIHSGR